MFGGQSKGLFSSHPARVSCVALAYALSGKFGLLFAIDPGYATAIWAPSGIALAAILIFGPAVWPGVWLGSFIVNVAVAFGSREVPSFYQSLLLPVGIGLGASAQAVVGGGFIRLFWPRDSVPLLRRTRSTLGLLVLGGPVSCLVNASWAVSLLAFGKVIHWDQFGLLWWTWWLGDMSGILIVAPFILAWRGTTSHHFTRLDILTAALLFAALGLACRMAFGDWTPMIRPDYPLSFLPLPLLLIAAYVFGPRGASTALVLVAGFSLNVTARGIGRFAAVGSPNEALLLMQGYLGVISFSSLLLSAAVTERRSVERALRKSKSQLSGVLQSALDAIITMDHEGKVADLNPAAERMFGYRRGAMLGRPLAELMIPLAQREEHRAALKQYLDTGQSRILGRRVEMTAMRADGSEFPVELSVNRVDSNGAPIFTGMARDITERKRLEARFRATVESAPTAMVMINSDGSIHLVNVEMEKLFGYTREELLGRPIESLIPERFRRGHPALRAAFFASPSARRMGVGRDLFGLRKDGSEFPVEIGLNPIQTEEGLFVLSAIVDISERKRAERELITGRDKLQQARLQLEAVLRSTPHGLCMLDPRWNVVWANDAMNELLRRDPERREEAVNFSALFETPESFQDFKAGIRGEIQRRGMAQRELCLKETDSVPFWFEIAVVRLDPEQTVSGYVASVTDVTRRKLDEEALRDSEQFLLAALNSLTDRIAILDHSGALLAVNECWRRAEGGFLGSSCPIGGNYLEAIRAELGERAAGLMRDIVDGIVDVIHKQQAELHVEYPFHEEDRKRWFVLHVTRSRGPGGTRAVLAHENITARKLNEEHLRHCANHDPLTGAANRSLFMESLQQAVFQKAWDRTYSFAVLFIDVDGFKEINDVYGHLVGDQVLVAAARRIRGCLRENDMLGRIGGDEFVLLLNNLDNVGEAMEIHQRIAGELSQPYMISDVKIAAPVSIGLALSDREFVNPEEVIQAADEAMYRAKKSGKESAD